MHDGDDLGFSEDTGELEPVKSDSAAVPAVAPNGASDGPEASPGPEPADAQTRRGGLTTVIAQGLLGGLALFLLAADPYAFTALEELIGFGLVIVGLFEVVNAFRKRQAAVAYVQPLIAVAAGVVLIVWPRQTLVIAGYFLAVVIALRGGFDVWSGARRWHEEGANTWVFIRGLIELTLAALVALFPTQSVMLVVVGGAILALGRAVLSIWFVTTHHDAISTIDPADTYGIVTYWLSRREMDAAEAEDVEDRVFLHRGDARERYWRFAILMGLATTIATFGIASDSTAVVIGAMLVAPLMTPILGTAAGLINGKTRATSKSALTVLLGAAGAIALAWALSALIPDLQAVVQNGQVTSRTSPNLIDLGIALAAGAAGAYGVSRAESTDALPGVAVAIALVPPLAVVGITLHAKDFGQAGGALLLFLTNLFSILLMAGLVFVLVGYGSWSRLYHRRNRIRVSFAAVAFAVVLISIPLAITAQRILQSAADLRRSSDAVEDWLGDDSALRIDAVEVSGDRVTVELVGPDAPPPSDDLAREISDRVGRDMEAVVRWILEQEYPSTGASAEE